MNIPPLRGGPSVRIKIGDKVHQTLVATTDTKDVRAAINTTPTLTAADKRRLFAAYAKARTQGRDTAWTSQGRLLSIELVKPSPRRFGRRRLDPGTECR